MSNSPDLARPTYMNNDSRTFTRGSLVLAMIALIVGCASAPPHYAVAPASDQPYPRGDAAAVYRAVLEKLYLSSPESPPIVVLWDSARFSTHDCVKWPCPTLPPHKSAIGRDVVRAFEEATRLTTPLTSSFGFSLPVMLLSASDSHALEAVGAPLSDSLRKANSYSEQAPYWLGFRKRFPSAWGYTVLTRVGLDRAHEHALVQVMHRCSSSCDHMEDMYLEKVGGRWSVVERMLVGPRGRDWVDVVQHFFSPNGDGKDSVVFGPLRYLGPDAHYLVNARRWNDSVKAVIKDSLARDQLPRRIHGTVTNHKTGTPIAFVQIFVRSAATSPNPSARVVADSLGRYEIHNPPFGGTMLEVQCPGTGPRQGATLDAPGLYVHAAIDTTINMVAPDISPCWTPRERSPGESGALAVRRVHRLEAGWLESPAARTASYPDSDGAAVYRAVLGVLRRSAKKTGSVFVLSDTTRERCIMPNDCGSPKLALLYAQHLVDSATIRDFLRQSRARVTLRPDQDYGGKTIFLTAAERDYLKAEGDPWHEFDGRLDPLWRVFHEVFPNSAGITSFTRVGFNPGKTQALVEVALEIADPDRKPPEMILLEKNGTKWHVVHRISHKESMSGTLKSGRCLPTTVPTGVAFKSTVSRLSGDFEIIEVETARDQGSRRFRIRLAEKGRVSLSNPGGVFDSTGEKINGLGVYIFDHGRESRIDIWDGALDGYGKTLTVRKISGLDFFGEWHSSYGNMIELNSAREMVPNPGGYFCAVHR